MVIIGCYVRMEEGAPRLWLISTVKPDKIIEYLCKTVTYINKGT